MSKKVVGPQMATLLNTNHVNVTKPKQPPIKAVKPLNGQVLVEVFSEEELADSPLFLPDIAKGKGNAGVSGAPQGRVLDMGPGLSSDFGIKVGDRVLLQGSFVPLPKLSDQRDGDRERALVEPHTIKALLIEDIGD